MNKRQFVQRRQSAWNRFQLLVHNVSLAQKGARSAEQITEFSRLFRELTSDLAVVRSRGWGQELEKYLNDLVGRGHNRLYSAPPGDFRRFLRLITSEFPRIFRANIGYFLVAAFLFFVPFGISWGMIVHDPTLASRIIPGQVLDQFDKMYDESRADDDDSVRRSGFAEARGAMAGFYVYHNVGIALRCFAVGIILAVGTVYTLLFNGIYIGAIAGHVISAGHGDRFLSFVVSHGAFELTAIAVAGAAGLMLGDALVHPGNRTRLESLRVRSLDAVKIAAGAAVMLTVAAVIEAFWSPSSLPSMVKYCVGGLLWVVVFAYLSLAGRRNEN